MWMKQYLGQSLCPGSHLPLPLNQIDELSCPFISRIMLTVRCRQEESKTQVSVGNSKIAYPVDVDSSGNCHSNQKKNTASEKPIGVSIRNFAKQGGQVRVLFS